MRRQLAQLASRMMLCVMAFVLTLGVVSSDVSKVAAACAAMPTDKGQVVETLTAPAAATYRVWSRIMVPDTTNNAFYMQIGSALCKTSIGGSASIQPNTWTWVDYQGGTTTSKVNVTLPAGASTLTMAGEDDGVEVDRVIITSDTSCTPTGTGDNCANPDTTPPSVNITSPTDGTTLSGTTTTITANATDNVQVGKVEFYIDGTLRSSDSSAPFTYALTNNSLTPGAHTVYAKAYDTSNLTTNSGTINFIVPDTVAPTTTITVPTAGTPLSGTAGLTATASDDVKVTKVEFYVNGVLKGSDNASPYSISLDTTTLTNGNYTITSKAYDAAGNVGTSAGVAVTVNNVTTPPPDTTAPVVGITSPTSSPPVSGAVVVNVLATDDVGVTRMEYYIDGVLKKTDGAAPFAYTMASGNYADGAHTLMVKAYDAAGNVGTSSTSITIQNVTYLPEDINQDGHVNILDFSLLAAQFGQSGSGLGRADINGDGAVNILDFSLLAAKFGT